MAASSAKLGVLAADTEYHWFPSGSASREVDMEGAESEELATPTSHAQYSPSVSHDEEDRANLDAGEGELMRVYPIITLGMRKKSFSSFRG